MDVRSALEKKVLVLDGAMGSLIQQYGLGEAEFRGTRFKDHPVPLQGNGDVLVLTQPAIVREIHDRYLAAGADIIETNTFNASHFSQEHYGLAHLVGELNERAASIARSAVDDAMVRDPSRPRFVAGALGPTTVTASISTDVDDPAARDVSFEALANTYRDMMQGLVRGGADVFLVETVFDVLNAKAALYAYTSLGAPLPMIVTGTVSDESGRLLSGHTPEAFATAIDRPGLLGVGLNCGLGAKQLLPFVRSLARSTPAAIAVYPNAGLPHDGEYDQTPAQMAKELEPYFAENLVNIIGSCCGSTPEHTRAIVELAQGRTPRKPPARSSSVLVAGLEPLLTYEGSNIINIGERANVSGSRAFLRAVREQDYDAALAVLRAQVDAGAQVLDINMDHADIDAVSEMQRIVRLATAEPAITRVPLMIDSSRWDVIETGLRNVNGKPIINSISLEPGEEEFIRRAKLAQAYGAAMVVMAMDERGQADTLERRINVSERAYNLLVNAGIHPSDIIIDPNVFPVGTSLAEHRTYAKDFFEAVRWIKGNLPLASTIGGISNVSFSFRGNPYVCEAMNTVFAYHARQHGLDMAILNPQHSTTYQDVPSDLRGALEDVLFDRSDNATEHAIAVAERYNKRTARQSTVDRAWRTLPASERLSYAVLNGEIGFLPEDLEQALQTHEHAIRVIDGPLMAGINEVGERFGRGEMYLPQVVKSARAMRQAVALLEPHLRAGAQAANKGTVVLATVEGDVHDIGKNLVGVVLECNGYRVVNLGVKQRPEDILAAAREHQAAVIGLSGLITPSLQRMSDFVRIAREQGVDTPILIGGATTSEAYTAARIADGVSPVLYVSDAARAPAVVDKLIGSDKESFLRSHSARQQAVKQQWENRQASRKLVPFAEAQERRLAIDWASSPTYEPPAHGLEHVTIPVASLIPYIDWTPFFTTWRIPGKYPGIFEHEQRGTHARELYDDAQTLLRVLANEPSSAARGAVGLFRAAAEHEDIMIFAPDGSHRASLPMLRQQEAGDGPRLSLVDYIAPRASGVRDTLGAFAVHAGIPESLAQRIVGGDDYKHLLLETVLDRLAEASAEWLHELVRKELWGYAPHEQFTPSDLLRESYQGIRPAPGYPACPDHSLKETIFALTRANDIGMSLTSSFAMHPAASVSGMYFAHPQAQYFTIKAVGEDQLAHYEKRVGRNDIRTYLPWQMSGPAGQDPSSA